MIAIEDERPEQRDAVAALHRAAFGGGEEAVLVARLRRDRLVALSRVAVEECVVLGHVLFSDLDVEVEGRRVRAIALAPVAVRPERQGQGIGTRLIRESLPALARAGYDAVIVLGHPAYYPRFGFSAALAATLEAPFSGPAFMALELRQGALAGRVGMVRYPPAFGL